MTRPRTGEVWHVRIGIWEGDRQIVSTHENTVEVSAPPDLHTDYYRWHEIEFLALLRRPNGRPMVMP